MTPTRAHGALKSFALEYPESHEDFPWGEVVVKVRAKVFLFLGRPQQGFAMSVKLPQSGLQALSLPFTSPTGYGLGKSGWVTASFRAGEPPPLELLKAWVDESYRAVAPRRLVAALDAVGVPPSARPERPAAPADRKKKKRKARAKKGARRR